MSQEQSPPKGSSLPKQLQEYSSPKSRVCIKTCDTAEKEEADRAAIYESALIKMLSERALQSTEGERLTWCALYSLMKKEAQLKERMDEQIEKLKDKYEVMRQPIYKDVSRVAIGKHVDSQLYDPKDIVCNVNPNVVVPLKIPNYWFSVMNQGGLANSSTDEQCMKKISQFTCELLSVSNNHIRIKFAFSQETHYFSNLTLEMQIKMRDGQTKQCIIRTPLDYKQQKQMDSLFTILFDTDIEAIYCHSFALEVYRTYINCLFFYFHAENESQAISNSEGEKDPNEDQEECNHQEIPNPNEAQLEQPKVENQELQIHPNDRQREKEKGENELETRLRKREQKSRKIIDKNEGKEKILEKRQLRKRGTPGQ